MKGRCLCSMEHTIKTDNKMKRAYLFCRKHWWIPLLITALPSGIPSLLGVMGDIEGLKYLYHTVEGVRYIKPDYAKLFFGCWLFSVFFTIAWHMLSQGEGKEETKRLFVYKKICDTIKQHNKEYSDMIMSIITDNKNAYKKNIAQAEKSLIDTSSRFNPLFRLKKVFSNIRIMLAETCVIDKNNISITLIYKNGENGNWRVLQSENPSPYEEDVAFLMNSRNSTYNAALKTKGGMIFYADKNEGVKNKQYIPNPKERTDKIEGSIFCKNLSVYKKGNKIKHGFVLAVSTRNVKIADPDDEYSLNMCKEILNYAVSLIEPEISIYCLNKYLLEGK